VFVLRVPPRAQRCVDVTGGGVAGGVHRRAAIAAVGRGDIRPPGGDGRGVQPRGAAHQTGLHSRHGAVERVLENRHKTQTNNQGLI